MKYTFYYESVTQDAPRGGAKMRAEYEFDGVKFEREGFAPNVSQAYTVIRSWRQEFRDQITHSKSEAKRYAAQDAFVNETLTTP